MVAFQISKRSIVYTIALWYRNIPERYGKCKHI